MMKHFDLVKLSQLYDNAFKNKTKTNLELEFEKLTTDTKTKRIEKIKLTEQDLKECIDYINDNVFCIDGGGYAIYKKNKIVVIANKQQFLDDVLNRFPEQLATYFKKTPKMIFYKLDCNPQKEIGVDKQSEILNAPLQIKAKLKSFDTFSKDTVDKLNIFLNHIKKVICNDDKAQYDYLLVLLKNMVQGIKNNVVVILSGASGGTGKSSLIHFLKEHVFGHETTGIGCETHLQKFNAGLYQKRLVYFEEADRMMTDGKKQAYIGRLKEWATESTLSYEDKGDKIFNSENYHTIFMTSNNVGFLGYEETGRKFFILDINPEMKGKEEYFNQLYSCQNDDVGECFVSYLINKIETPVNFVADVSMPLTQNKKDAYAERLDKPLLYIKKNYVLKKLGINMRLKDLYTQYAEQTQCRMTATKFNKILKEYFMDYISSEKNKIPLINGFPKFVISSSELNKMYKKHNWVYEGVDEYEPDEDAETETIDYEQDKDLVELLTKENEDLKRKIVELEKQLKLQSQEKNVNNSEEDQIESNFEDIKKELTLYF